MFRREEILPTDNSLMISETFFPTYNIYSYIYAKKMNVINTKNII